MSQEPNIRNGFALAGAWRYDDQNVRKVQGLLNQGDERLLLGEHRNEEECIFVIVLVTVQREPTGEKE